MEKHTWTDTSRHTTAGKSDKGHRGTLEMFLHQFSSGRVGSTYLAKERGRAVDDAGGLRRCFSLGSTTFSALAYLLVD